MDNFIKFIVAGSGSTVAYFFGGWTALLQILVVFIAIDYLTGLVAAGYDGKLSSKVGFRGIAKKIMILTMVAVAHAIDIVLGGDSHFIRDAVIFFYLANELLSIIENAGKTGVPIPNVLTKAVDVLNNKSKGADK
jgi:toxin secretion/phage lysis holin